MWCEESYGSWFFILPTRLELAGQCLKPEMPGFFPWLLNQYLRWEPGICLFFKRPLKVSLGWETLRQGTTLWWTRPESVSLSFFESKQDLWATRTPSLSPQSDPRPDWGCASALLRERKIPGQTRKQTGVSGQEAGRFICVSAPMEVKRRSEKSERETKRHRKQYAWSVWRPRGCWEERLAAGWGKGWTDPWKGKRWGKLWSTALVWEAGEPWSLTRLGMGISEIPEIPEVATLGWKERGWDSCFWVCLNNPTPGESSNGSLCPQSLPHSHSLLHWAKVVFLNFRAG